MKSTQVARYEDMVSIMNSDEFKNYKVIRHYKRIQDIILLKNKLNSSSLSTLTTKIKVKLNYVLR